MARYLIDGNRVSRDWYYALRGAELDGVTFTLNDGRRTIAEQWQRVRAQGVWSPSNPHGAARPTPWAPHIRVGRQDHALDVSTLDGGLDRLRAWLARQGVATTLTVPGEAWHAEADSAAALHELAERIRRRMSDPLFELRGAPLKPGAHSELVRPVQVDLVRGRYLPRRFRVARKVGTYGPRVVKAVKAFQRHVGLPADGVIGPKTFAALRRRHGRKAEA